MNHLTNIGCPAKVILQNVFRPIFDSELQSAVAAAILSTEDRMQRASEAKDVTPRSSSPAAPAEGGENVFDLSSAKLVKPYGDNEL